MKSYSKESFELTEYKALFNAVDEAIVVHYFDSRGKPSNFINFNDVMCKRYGYSREELLKMSPMDIDDPDSFKKYAIPAIKKLLKDGKVTFETVHVTKKGQKIPVEISAVIFEINGRKAMLSVARDITERKRIEEKLRENEHFIYESQSSAFIGSYQTDFVRNRWRSSEILDRIFGIDEDYNRSVKGWLEIVHPDDRKMMDKYLREEVIAKHRSFNKEYRIVRKSDRQTRWVSGLGKMSFDKKGNPLTMSGTIQDITERKKIEEEILNSQRLLQRIIDLLPIRVFWKDKDLKYLGCNEIFAKDAGKKSPAELIGKDDFQMNWKEQAKAYRNDDLKVMNSGKTKLNYEEPQTTPKGDMIWLKTSKLPLTDSNGNTIGILGAYEDITERKKAETSLKKTEEKYRAILDYSTDQIFMIDTKLKYISVGKSLAKSLGKNPEDMLNKSLIEIFGKSEEEIRFMENIKHVLSGKESKSIEEEIILNGKKNYISTQLSPVKDSSGKVTAVLGIVRNNTEEKNAENALHSEQERARVYLNTVETIIVALDTKGKITSINRKGCQALGRKEDELIGQSWFSTCLPQTKEKTRVYAVFKKIMNGDIGNVEYYENSIITKSGEIRKIAWHNSSLHNADGKIVGTLASGEDITEKKKAEDELMKSKKFLQDKINDLEIFHKIAIDRELKMIELKDTIKKLEENLIKHQKI